MNEGQGPLCAAFYSLLSVVTGAMDINTDCSYSRARDTDVASGSNPKAENIMAMGGSTDYSGLHQQERLNPQTLTWP